MAKTKLNSKVVELACQMAIEAIEADRGKELDKLVRPHRKRWILPLRSFEAGLARLPDYEKEANAFFRWDEQKTLERIRALCSVCEAVALTDKEFDFIRLAFPLAYMEMGEVT